MRKKNTTGLDHQIGVRLKELRLARNVSQTMLGEQLGVTFQQIQKYENGSNRISSSALFEIARFFNVPLAHFFENIGNQVVSISTSEMTPEIAELINSFQSLPIDERKDLLTLLRLVKGKGR